MSATDATGTPDTAVPVVERVMTPLGDAVVLEMLPEARQRASGLILPEGTRVRYDLAKLAKIVDVGPGVREALFADQEVMVAPFHDGVEVTVPGTGRDGLSRFRIVSERAIVAVLSPDRPPVALWADLERTWLELVRLAPERALEWLQKRFQAAESRG